MRTFRLGNLFLAYVRPESFTALNATKFNIFNIKLRILLFLHSKMARLSTHLIEHIVKVPMPYLDFKVVTLEVSAT